MRFNSVIILLHITVLGCVAQFPPIPAMDSSGVSSPEVTSWPTTNTIDSYPSDNTQTGQDATPTEWVPEGTVFPSNTVADQSTVSNFNAKFPTGDPTMDSPSVFSGIQPVVSVPNSYSTDPSGVYTVDPIKAAIPIVDISNKTNEAAVDFPSQRYASIDSTPTNPKSIFSGTSNRVSPIFIEATFVPVFINPSDGLNSFMQRMFSIS